jgi:restriction endonuclease S subunit
LPGSNLSENCKQTVDDLVTVVSAPLKIKSSDVLKTGTIPVIDQSQKYITGYTNENASKISEVPVVAFGDHTRAIKYIDFDFAQGADGIKIFKPKRDDLNVKYLYYILLNTEIPNKGYSRHWSEVKLLKIAVPPIEVQLKIAAELDAEQKIIDANKKLIEIYQQKIKDKLAEIWGE